MFKEKTKNKNTLDITPYFVYHTDINKEYANATNLKP